MDAGQSVEAIQTSIPNQLAAEAKTLVADGWYKDMNELLLDALRRFLESHQTGLAEQFIEEDVAWGLQGKD